MKKLLLFLLLIIFISPVFAAQWLEIFEKKYIDMSSLKPNYQTNSIQFWTKNLNKNPKDTVHDINGKNIQYWYSLSYWNIDCNNKMERIEAIAIYDLKDNLIISDNNIPEWQPIIPESYAEGYYNLFCKIPYNQNPLLNN